MDRKECIEKLAKEGKTVSQISKELDLEYSTVRYYILTYNIEVKKGKIEITDEIINNILDLYREGLTNKQIADELGTNSATVRKYLKLNGISEFNSKRTKRISTQNIELTKEQLEIIYGSLLGDANIRINWKNARLTFTHGGNQENYFDFKCSYFSGILGKINKTPRYDKRTNKYYNRYTVRTLSHPKFTEIFYECYPNGIKTVSEEWLNKITPRGLAIWYMDDGCNDGTLATNSFTYDEVVLIKNWFLKTYNLEVNIQKRHQNGHDQYLIYILEKTKPLFYNIVKDYIIESMSYKFKGWTR